MTPGEEYRIDLKRQKQHEKSVKSQSAWALRQYRTREKYLKEIKNLKLNTLYKATSNTPWPYSIWQYFVLRERNLKQHILIIEVMFNDWHIEQKVLDFSAYHSIRGHYDQVYNKKEKTKIGLRGLIA